MVEAAGALCAAASSSYATTVRLSAAAAGSRLASSSSASVTPQYHFGGLRQSSAVHSSSFPRLNFGNGPASSGSIASGVRAQGVVIQDYCPLVKMCGITSAEDAALAAQAGAFYIGMIMWPKSKRSVSMVQAREICAAAREFGAEPVGVFVDENAGQIQEACETAGLSFAQLHGEHARASALQMPSSLKIIYVMHADPKGSLKTNITPEQENAIDWVLVDGLEGGSGLKFDWANFEVPAICSKKGWLLAGGLKPDNVALAVSTLRPNAVDVSSGITGPDGIRKDPRRILAFMEAVNSASSLLV